MPSEKLAQIVAKRHGLDAEEAMELTGRTLAELTSHARHIIGRRNAVDAAKRRNPGIPDYAIEGSYDGGGVRVDDHAGRELAVDALRDQVNGRDRKTTDFLASLGRRTLADDDREGRVADRLRAAGFGRED